MRTIPGVVQGIVTNVSDPDGLGRVQLQFPWLDQSYRSTWVPIATPLTGGTRGQFFMPEVGDEVMAAFERGDFDHPFVIGFLWNGVDRPPETDVKNRVILTPGGHTLRFEDGDAKKVILKSSGDHQIILDDGSPKKVTVQSSSGHQVILDDTPGAGSITIQTPGSQSVVLKDAPPSIKLQGGGRSIELSNGMVQIT